MSHSYQVMLVDDEYLELEMLVNHVPWPKLGFQVAATASDGQEALAQLAHIRPDVVVTDVKMPFMNGIAFAEKVHALYPKIRLVFLSGYGQFDFLKAALQVEADDYLLKPVDLNEFAKVMETVRRKCDAQNARSSLEKAALPEQLRSLITRDGAADSEALPSADALCASYFDIASPGAQYWPAVITLDEARYLQQNQDILGFSPADVRHEIQKVAYPLPCILLEMKQNVYFYLSPHDPERAFSAWKASGSDVQEFITVVYNDIPVSAGSLGAQYHALLLLRHDLVLLHGSGQLKAAGQLRYLSKHPVQPDDTLPDVSPLPKALMANDAACVKEFLSAFFSRSKCGNIHIQAVEMLDIADTQLGISVHRPELYGEKKVAFFKRLLDVESIPLLHHMVETHLLCMMSLLSPGAADGRESMVRDVRDYILAHYHQPFTISHLAETLHYSPNYIRFVFKQVTDRTVLEEITRVRMEKAAQLLTDTTLKIKQICEKIGYANPSYFSNQFIRHFGVTPQKYRGKVNL